MALKNYTTQKEVTETVGDIHKKLAKAGAKKIMFEYDDDSHLTAIRFIINTPEGERAILLPANIDRVQEVLKKQQAAKGNKAKIDSSYEQAERTAWRIVLNWVEAQLAILETEMVEVSQLFLPYFVNGQGQTLFEIYKSGQLLLGE